MRQKRLIVATAVAAAVVLGGCGSETAPSHSLGGPPDATPGAVATVAPGSPAVSAATAFLESLSSDQRETAVLALGDSRRSNWSNLPPGSVRFERNGVRIGDLDLEQTDALHHFLATALSRTGYEVVTGIVRAEDALAQSRGGDSSRFSADNYWLAFFGEPSVSAPWGWQFGGHHLAVNVTVVSGRSYLSPTFLGIEPATFVYGNSTVAPLDPYLQAGLALINGLDAEALATATLVNRPSGVVTGAGRDGMVPESEGAEAGDWSVAQQQLLLDAIALWVGLLDEVSAQARIEEIRADLRNIHFAWSGDESGRGPLYFRIQGPTLIIEFSTQGRLSGGGAHYHSMYRNPTNEYGSSAAASN